MVVLSKIKIILWRILGWIMLIAGLISILAMAFEGGSVSAFVICGIVAFIGLCLTGYKRTRKTLKESEVPSQPAPVSESPKNKREPEAPAQPPKPANPQEDRSARIATLEKQIEYHQNSYYNGELDISDEEFDLLWDELKSLSPKSPLLRHGVYIQPQKPPKKPKKPKAPVQPKAPKDTPIWEGRVYRLEYEDADGITSDRKIKISKIENGGRPRNSYIFAYCFQAMAARQFRFDRIIGFYDDTGREIENPWHYFSKNPTKPAKKNTSALAAEALSDNGANNE